MALRKCLECGQMISDKAESCPNCGTPIAKEKGSGENAITMLKWSISAYALVKILINIINVIYNKNILVESSITMLAFALVIIGVQCIKRKAYILAVVGFVVLTLSMFVDIARLAERIGEKEKHTTEKLSSSTEEENTISYSSYSIEDDCTGTFQIEDSDGHVWTLKITRTNGTPIYSEGKCTIVCEELGEEHYGSWSKNKGDEHYCKLNFIGDDFYIPFPKGRVRIMLAEISIGGMWFYDSGAAKAGNPKLRLKMKRISK